MLKSFEEFIALNEAAKYWNNAECERDNDVRDLTDAVKRILDWDSVNDLRDEIFLDEYKKVERKLFNAYIKFCKERFKNAFPDKALIDKTVFAYKNLLKTHDDRPYEFAYTMTYFPGDSHYERWAMKDFKRNDEDQVIILFNLGVVWTPFVFISTFLHELCHAYVEYHFPKEIEGINYDDELHSTKHYVKCVDMVKQKTGIDVLEVFYMFKPKDRMVLIPVPTSDGRMKREYKKDKELTPVGE